MPTYNYYQAGGGSNTTSYSMTRDNQYTMVSSAALPISITSSAHLFNVPQPVWFPLEQPMLYSQSRSTSMQPSMAPTWPQDSPAQNLSTMHPEAQQPISRRHSSEPEPQLERNRKCRWCDRTFAHESSKCRHEKEHFNAFPCPEEGCRVISSRKDSLKRHLRLMHGISSRSSSNIGKREVKFLKCKLMFEQVLPQ